MNENGTITAILKPDRKYKPDVLRAVKAFRRSKPWQGGYEAQKAKFESLHASLCEVYKSRCKLVIEDGAENGGSGDSYYDAGTNEIHMTGFSVITYLHEFAHSLGKSHKGAAIWSVNLFKRLFKKSWERAQFKGGVILNSTDAANEGDDDDDDEETISAADAFEEKSEKSDDDTESDEEENSDDAEFA